MVQVLLLIASASNDAVTRGRGVSNSLLLGSKSASSNCSGGSSFVGHNGPSSNGDPRETVLLLLSIQTGVFACEWFLQALRNSLDVKEDSLHESIVVVLLGSMQLFVHGR